MFICYNILYGRNKRCNTRIYKNFRFEFSFCFNSLQLPYNELLQHSLLAYLFSRNITGTGLCKGVRDNSLNLAIRIGLINTKFASMANTTFLKQNNGILRAFFLDSLKQYAKENDYFYEEATDKTREEVINLYMNRIFRTFQSTHQYFCASQAHHNNKKINDLIVNLLLFLLIQKEPRYVALFYFNIVFPIQPFL